MLVAVEMKGTVDLGTGGQNLEGTVHAEGDEFGYRIEGHFEHIDGIPRKSWEYAIRFPALFRCDAGDKTQVRVVLRRARRALIEHEEWGEFIASAVSPVVEKAFWIEAVTDDGVLRLETSDTALLEYIANEADIVSVT